MAKAVIEVRWEGFRELEKALKALPRVALVKSTITRALKESAEPAVRRAWELAPKLTGDMADSISARVLSVRRGGSRDAVTVALGPDADHFYAIFSEFGTFRQPSRPFLRPAWDQHKERVLQHVGAEMWKALERTAKRLAKRRARGLRA